MGARWALPPPLVGLMAQSLRFVCSSRPCSASDYTTPTSKHARKHTFTPASRSATNLRSSSSETTECCGCTTIFSAKRDASGDEILAQETRRATNNYRPGPVLREADRHAAQLAKQPVNWSKLWQLGFRRDPTPTDSMMTAHEHQYPRQSTTLSCRRVRSRAGDLKPFGNDWSQRTGWRCESRYVTVGTGPNSARQSSAEDRGVPNIREHTPVNHSLSAKKSWDFAPSWKLWSTVVHPRRCSGPNMELFQ
jgi:hypothetical protein